MEKSSANRLGMKFNVDVNIYFLFSMSYFESNWGTGKTFIAEAHVIMS